MPAGRRAGRGGSPLTCGAPGASRTPGAGRGRQKSRAAATPQTRPEPGAQGRPGRARYAPGRRLPTPEGKAVSGRGEPENEVRAATSEVVPPPAAPPPRRTPSKGLPRHAPGPSPSRGAQGAHRQRPAAAAPTFGFRAAGKAPSGAAPQVSAATRAPPPQLRRACAVARRRRVGSGARGGRGPGGRGASEAAVALGGRGSRRGACARRRVRSLAPGASERVLGPAGARVRGGRSAAAGRARSPGLGGAGSGGGRRCSTASRFGGATVMWRPSTGATARCSTCLRRSTATPAAWRSCCWTPTSSASCRR